MVGFSEFALLGNLFRVVMFVLLLVGGFCVLCFAEFACVLYVCYV